MTISPPIQVNEAFESYTKGVDLIPELDGVATRVRVMELHLTAENGRWAFIALPGKGVGWFRVNLDANPQETEKV